jgi:tetraacyldisaccharide 4'-kinase
MMAADVPVVVSRDRVAGAALARSRGASVILMDDGFQNPALVKDASLIVIDGHRGLGNGQVIPAGPLRAPLAPQLARTDALVIVGDGVAADAVAAAVGGKGGVVLRAHLTPDQTSVDALRGKRVLAFAGIGDPPRFFATLRGSGIEVVAEHPFPDHHPYSAPDLDSLVEVARRENLVLLTTRKDLARIGARSLPVQLLAFAVTLDFDDPAALRSFVRGRLEQARARKFRS